MKNDILFYIAILSLCLFDCYSQAPKISYIDKQNEKYAIIDPIKTYERIVEKGYKSVDMFEKLGNSYFLNAELDKAARWYGELFAMTTNVEPKYYYRYTLCLRSIGQIEKANQILGIYYQKSGNANEIQNNDKITTEDSFKNNYYEK
jgi:hypothetical protein